MELPSVSQIITIAVSALSLIVAYLGFRDKKSDKIDKELSDKIKANVLADAVNSKAAILSDAVNTRAAEIKELQKQMNDTIGEMNILNERIDSLTKISDKMDEKLDKIMDYLIEDRDKA